MRPSSSGTSSRYVETKPSIPTGGGASLVTTFLLALILATGPIVLGGARLWIQLPLLVGLALLFFGQGLRLVLQPPHGTHGRVDAIDLTVLVFVLYTVGRWLTSPAEYFSRIEAFNVVAYAGAFFICRYGVTRRMHGIALLLVLVTLGVFEGAFGYYLSHYSNPGDPKSLWFLYGPTESLQTHYYPRWLGTYGCPNHYASLLIMAMAAALALGSFSKFPWPVRIVLFYLAAMMLIALMYSGSRGGWISCAAMITFLTIFGLRNGAVRWWIPLTALIIVLVSTGVIFSKSPDVQARLAEVQDTIKSGNLDKYVRIQLAEDALHIARDYPIWGTGPATFVFVHPRYQSSTFAYKAVLTHDDYLNCLDDYGIVGFGIAMIFVALVTLKFFSPLRADNRWQDRVIVATGFAAWAALVVHSVFDFNLHIPGNALMFFALTGLAMGKLSREEVVHHWSTLPIARLGQGLGWALVIFSLVYGAEVGRTAVGAVLYEQARTLAEEIPVSESITNTKEALKYDQGNVPALLFLGDLYRYRASQEKEIEGRVSEGQKALDAYQAALRGNALDDTIQARLGRTYDIMRRYTEAFFSYKAAAAAQPYNGEFWYWLGNHYWQRGMLNKAEEAYLKASACPYGYEGSLDSIKELRQLPQMEDVPQPEPGTNPLTPSQEVIQQSESGTVP